MAPNTVPTFEPLTGLYEPSAIQQLPDGRFLVVEDEKEHSFSLLTFSTDGAARSQSLPQVLNTLQALDLGKFCPAGDFHFSLPNAVAIGQSRATRLPTLNISQHQ